MLIAVEYFDGRIKEFDMTSFVDSTALKVKTADGAKRHASVLAEFDLRVDRIEKEGLRLDMYWYDMAVEAGTIRLDDVTDERGRPVRAPRAGRKVGCTVRLVSRAGMRNVCRVYVHRAGSQVLAAWRQSTADGKESWLINGAKFDAQRTNTYTDPKTTSLNTQALAVFNYLRRVNKDLPVESICKIMGYPKEAIDFIAMSESAQPPKQSAKNEDNEQNDVGFGNDSFSPVVTSFSVDDTDNEDDQPNAMDAFVSMPDNAYADEPW